MKIMLVLAMVVVCLAVSAAQQTTYNGTAGFTNTQSIVPYCLIYGYETMVLANNDVFDNGEACGKQVTITCMDAQYCDTTKQYTVPIANLCNGCAPTFTFTGPDYNTIGNGDPNGINIEYVM